MPTFYKAVIQATASGQDINNILYYAPSIPTEASFDEGTASDLGTAIGTAWGAQMLPILPTTYTLQTVDMSMVDEDGVTVSDYVISVPAPGVGTAQSPTATVAQVCVYKFNCQSVSQAPGHGVPRRSYLAVGPLTEAQVDASGAFVTVAAFQTALDAATTQGHLISATEYVPYRIGRTPKPTLAEPNPVPAGVGRVVSGIVRPFTSFRKSRLQRPTGG